MNQDLVLEIILDIRQCQLLQFRCGVAVVVFVDNIYFNIL